MPEIVEIRDEFGEFQKSHRVASGAFGLRRAGMEGANQDRDNLGGSASLEGADLNGANLRATLLEGATYDEKTRFPAGFDPRQAGMVRANDG